MKDDFLKKVVVCLGLFLLIFTAIILLIFVLTGGSEPSTLIACVFAACLGEASICGLLKNTRTKHEKIDYNDYSADESSGEDNNIAG